MRKPPPATVQPITAAKLREILKSKHVMGRYSYHVPLSHELSVLAAVLTGWQSCNLEPDREWASYPCTREFTHQDQEVASSSRVPFWLRIKFDVDRRAIGHPDYERGWRDAAHDIAARLRPAMERANPGRRFGKGGPIARFIAEVVPLIFPGKMPLSADVRQHLVQPYQRKRRKRRARR
jgi:hypothetical protein